MAEKRFYVTAEAALHESLNEKARTLNQLLSSAHEHLTGLAEVQKAVQHTLSEMDELCSDMNTGVVFHERDVIISVPSEQFKLAKGKVFGEFAEVLAYFCEQKHKEDVSALLGGAETELLEDLHRRMSKQKTEASSKKELEDILRLLDDPKSDIKELKRRLNNVLGRIDTSRASTDLQLHINVYDEQARMENEVVQGSKYVIVPTESFCGESRKIEGVSHVEAEGNFVTFYNGIKVVARIDNTKFNFFLID